MEDIMKLDSEKDMISLANKKSAEILNQIHSVVERIKSSKELAENAREMKAGLFGKTKKKADATANALVGTNEAIVEMNNLIQESIRFTCTSIEFSSAMHKAMAKMVARGFKDSNGEIVKLNETGEEFANLIISEAEDFTKKQMEIDKLQQEQESRLNELGNISDEKDAELEAAIHKLEEESDRKDAELATIIQDKTEEILSHSDLKDKEHDEKIAELQSLSSKLQTHSDANDEKHDKQIKELYKFTEKNTEKIKVLEKGNTSLFKVISVVALIISATSLVITFTGL